MRRSYAPRGSSILVKTPSRREQTARHRLMAICALVALALASGLIGSLTAHRSDAPEAAHTGPFSYFPSE